MKIREGFIRRCVAGETLVVSVDEDRNYLMGLNATAELLWCELEKGTDETSLIQLLRDMYGISKEQASQDVRRFLTILREKDILE